MTKVRNVTLFIFAIVLLCAVLLYCSGFFDLWMKPHEYKGVFVMTGGCS